jgi:hypothetical protein
MQTAPRLETPSYTPILQLIPTRDNLIPQDGFIQTNDTRFPTQLDKFKKNPCYSEYRETVRIGSQLGNDGDLGMALRLETDYSHVQPQTPDERIEILTLYRDGYFNAAIAARRRAQSPAENNQGMHIKTAEVNYQKGLEYQKQLDEIMKQKEAKK